MKRLLIAVLAILSVAGADLYSQTGKNTREGPFLVQV
jgi:hypothetical protein